MTYTKQDIARAALEAGIGVEKIKQMLQYFGDTTVLRSNECAGRTEGYRLVPVRDQEGRVVGQQYSY